MQARFAQLKNAIWQNEPNFPNDFNTHPGNDAAKLALNFPARVYRPGSKIGSRARAGEIPCLA
jgi:hypothetical protein